jgi:hypothetical protein
MYSFSADVSGRHLPVTDGYYTKTIQYQDINYQLSQNEDKTAIFDSWCDFLNYFDSSVKFQLSFVNMSASRDTWARSISIPLQETGSTASAGVHGNAPESACPRQPTVL